ncbi:5-oxoprolinase subunit PxpB [Pedobacter cryophilus]|uniref:5-oxoprolinase subunit PxpB n=1 Tax=Pedobacter cryophilus TaxID=2571271 RepID=A0A4U1C9L2_9SPHI|nr:5-oxoprolinase subunit PxpB [Pedobacter cryophilus]TKC00338.1 5-oxoprolinase subunit PxpB [Pedobacter cryophilus]
MAHNHTKFLIYPISEKAVSIEFGQKIEAEIMKRISNLNRLILENPFIGLDCTVPAYTTLTLFYNPVKVISDKNLSGKFCFDKVSNYLSQMAQTNDNSIEKPKDIINIPVCYDEQFGLDLDELSILHQVPKEKIIKLHSSAIYTVFMIGFVPGFAYLGGMPELLASPRKLTPRKFIPAGSVGIAGQQTGIYPLETPGGWQIIGKTPLTLFDVNREQPSLLKAGDSVKFNPISLANFQSYHEDKD